MKHLVSPSILNADFANLEKEIKMLNGSLADWIHLDVMDGIYVPNLTFGFPVIARIKDIAEKPLDVHLMIADADRHILNFRDAGASVLTVHQEACTHLNRTVNLIRDSGMRAGVALNPHTPVSVLKNILPYIDMVLIMTVNPGYGGQKFISESFNKIRELRAIIDSGSYKVLIQVDGGVDTLNASELIDAGVDVLVAGNAVFSSPDPVATITRLKNLQK